MVHAQCEFINPNGSCSLPVCFVDKCMSESTAIPKSVSDSDVFPSVSLFTDILHEHGVFKAHMPLQSIVLYVPPVAILHDKHHSVIGQVVSSWWWSEQHTLFIQVYMGKYAQTSPMTKLTIQDFPITCINNGGQYQICTLQCNLEKTKNKTE